MFLINIRKILHIESDTEQVLNKFSLLLVVLGSKIMIRKVISLEPDTYFTFNKWSLVHCHHHYYYYLLLLHHGVAVPGRVLGSCFSPIAGMMVPMISCPAASHRQYLEEIRPFYVSYLPLSGGSS